MAETTTKWQGKQFIAVNVSFVLLLAVGMGGNGNRLQANGMK